MKIAIFVLFSLIAGTSFADSIQVQVDQAIHTNGFSLGVGSRITLKVPGMKTSHAGVFLGQLVQPDGTISKYMVLDQDSAKVYLADEKDIDFPKASFEPILRQYDQINGNCTGYAMDHFMQQLYWSGFTGTGKLKEELSTEKGRTQLLVEAIDDYYMVPQHKLSIKGILNTFGKRFGFKCEKKMFSDSTNAINYVEKNAKAGNPVLISFFIGPNMATSDIKITDYKTNKSVDPRLWIPRKTGERESGGHSVVVAGAFEYKGREKLLMLDSDWSEPRIWDVQDYLGNAKTAVAELEFYTCK